MILITSDPHDLAIMGSPSLHFNTAIELAQDARAGVPFISRHIDYRTITYARLCGLATEPSTFVLRARFCRGWFTPNARNIQSTPG